MWTLKYIRTGEHVQILTLTKKKRVAPLGIFCYLDTIHHHLTDVKTVKTVKTVNFTEFKGKLLIER